MKFHVENCLLYAVTDRTWLRGQTLEEQVEAALRGGVTMVQLREKDLDQEAFEEEARRILALCRRYHVPLLISGQFRHRRCDCQDGGAGTGG